MKYFKINYDKLENLKIAKFSNFILIIIMSVISVIIISCFTYTKKSNQFLGVYNNHYLKTYVERNQLSELINAKNIRFNGKLIKVESYVIDDIELNSNNININMKLNIDEELNDSIGVITIERRKERIIKYILELFK